MDSEHAADSSLIGERIDRIMGMLRELNGVALSLRSRLDVAAIRQEAALRSLGELVPGFSQKFAQLCSGHRKTLTEIAQKSDETLRREVAEMLGPDENGT